MYLCMCLWCRYFTQDNCFQFPHSYVNSIILFFLIARLFHYTIVSWSIHQFIGIWSISISLLLWIWLWMKKYFCSNLLIPLCTCPKLVWLDNYPIFNTAILPSLYAEYTYNFTIIYHKCVSWTFYFCFTCVKSYLE